MKGCVVSVVKVMHLVQFLLIPFGGNTYTGGVRRTLAELAAMCLHVHTLTQQSA